MKLFRVGMTCAALLACTSVARAVDTLENIEKACVEKWKDVKSFSAKMSMQSEQPMPGGQGQSMKMNGTGTMEYLYKGEKELSRIEMSMNTEMSGMQMKSDILTINDGEFVYILQDSMGMKMAMKQKPDQNQQQHMIGGQKMFDQLKKDKVVTVLPDEKVDGKDCYVLEVKDKVDPAKPAQPSEAQQSGRVFICKADGVTVKHQMLDKDGKATTTMTMTDTKVNPKLEDSRFVFKAPPGVEIQDMSKMAMPATPGKP